jgi:hypothetical protein
MNKHLRPRFWINSFLSALSGLLCLITPIWPDWIEFISGWDPDQHSGAVEWLIAAALLIVSAVMIALARTEWRRTAPQL